MFFFEVVEIGGDDLRILGFRAQGFAYCDGVVVVDHVTLCSACGWVAPDVVALVEPGCISCVAVVGDEFLEGLEAGSFVRGDGIWGIGLEICTFPGRVCC